MFDSWLAVFLYIIIVILIVIFLPLLTFAYRYAMEKFPLYFIRETRFLYGRFDWIGMQMSLNLVLRFLLIQYIYIIIIMSCRPHGYPWPSLATFPYRSSPPASLLDYIPYLHIAAVCMFELVVLLLLGHKWGSIGVHHLWARLYSSSSVLCAWFV